MKISSRNRFRSVSKEPKERREKTPLGSIRYASIDRNKVYFKTKIKDYHSNYNHMYRSVNYDKSIIEKKIPLSNIININNTINIRNHPINISLTPDTFNDNIFYMNQKNINTPKTYKRINKTKLIKMVLIIQSFVRRFLSYKKYINELANLKLGFNSKIKIYKKKLLKNKNKINFQISNKIKNVTNISNNVNINYKKTVDKKNYFFTKLIVINSIYDKEKILKIQKFWRKINNNFKKNSQYNSEFFNSINSLKDLEGNMQVNNKAINTKSIRIMKARIKKLNIGNFNKFHSDSSSIKRPKFIDLNNFINKTVAFEDKHKEEEEDDEDVYNYEVIDEENFRGKSFTLLHDFNQNGNYIEKIDTNFIKNKKSITLNNSKLSHHNNNIFLKFLKNKNKNKDYENIINNLKIWKKIKINCNIYKENMFKYRHLTPNKNLICYNFYKPEKLISLYKKKDIVKKPNVNYMKKIYINKKRNSLKNSNIKNVLISKYFIFENSKENNLVLERRKIMKKPNPKNI